MTNDTPPTSTTSTSTTSTSTTSTSTTATQYNYYELVAQHDDSGDTVALYSSYVKAECLEELREEKRNYIADGYSHFEVVHKTTTEDPSAEVYTPAQLSSIRANATQPETSSAAPLEIFKAAVRELLKRYGLSTYLLSDDELAQCWGVGLNMHHAYNIACDVNAGFGFNESLAANGI